ncbi:DUF2147 domain-containing protein [Flavobacteriaceae bacterium TP-CH-4]|uniref:DUF2147 domain-containing protein n=1 Tax=Pelagihabitans pacificus TaxID=2696054 RepID=A0A967E7F5_9FLAO|nr:DUF2147 domain-containing protein [Pelagihabitans pacificus]NHF60199.1 DUF2147 domain-containing protein [Pelagihabitans pacificus]
MKHFEKRVFTTLACVLLTLLVKAQDIYGEWKTIDDETGEAKSVVEIYENDGKVYGKIVELLQEEDRGRLCTKCEGDDKNKPVKGLVIMKEMKKDGDEYEDGTIFDPKKGKRYDCKIWIDDDNPDILNVRGYVSFFYRTQQWHRK